MKDTECDTDRSRLSRLATVVALIGCALWLGGAAGVAHGARADTTLTPSQLNRLHTITEWDITYTETRTWTGTGSRTRHGFGFAGPQTETDSHTYLDTWNTTARYTVGSPTGQECVWFRSCTPNLDRPLSVEHTHILRDRHQSIFTGGCPFGASG